ncbi:MAG: hypothetical protein ACRD10_00735 [Terriglobia bacterium]
MMEGEVAFQVGGQRLYLHAAPDVRRRGYRSSLAAIGQRAVSLHGGCCGPRRGVNGNGNVNPIRRAD